MRLAALRSHIALLLLLCLTRTLLPESWILGLHEHAHTTDEPAQSAGFAGFRHKGKALLSPKHQHCQTEHFYQVPLLLSAPVVVPRPVARPCFALAAVPTVDVAPWVARRPAPSRGPPVV